MSLKPVPPEVVPEEAFSWDPRRKRYDPSNVKETMQLLRTMSKTSFGDSYKERVQAAHSPSLLQEMADSVNGTVDHMVHNIKSQGMPSTPTGAILVGGCMVVNQLTLPVKLAGSFFITPVIKRGCDLAPGTRRACDAVAGVMQTVVSFVDEQSRDIEKTHGVASGLLTQCVMDLPLLSAVPLPAARTRVPPISRTHQGSGCIPPLVSQSIPLPTLVEKTVTFLPAAARTVGAQDLVRHPLKVMDVLKENKNIFLRSLEAEIDLYRRAELSTGEKTAIYIMPKTGNRLTHLPHFHDEFLRLAKDSKMVVARVSHSTEIDAILSQEMKDSVSVVWVSAHGTPKQIYLGKDYAISGTGLVRNWPKEVFAPQAKVVLESCKVGTRLHDGTLNFATEVQQQLGERVQVIAPSTAIDTYYNLRRGCTHKDLLVTPDGHVSFTTRHRVDVTANLFPHLETLSLGISNIVVQRGDVCLVHFPEPTGVRPALIISSDVTNRIVDYNTVIAAYLTSNIKKIFPSTEVPTFFDFRQGKIKLGQMTAIPKTAILKHLGRLDEATLAKVDNVIKSVLDIQ